MFLLSPSSIQLNFNMRDNGSYYHSSEKVWGCPLAHQVQFIAFCDVRKLLVIFSNLFLPCLFWSDGHPSDLL